MTKFFGFDLETSISKGPHGPSAKDPTNSFYTIIYGDSPENVTVEHRAHGFGRQLPKYADMMLTRSDVIVGHNLPFDLSYIWGSDCLEEFLLRGGQVWDTQIAEYLLSGQRHSFASLAELQQIYLGGRIKEDRISKLFKKGIGADLILAARTRCPRLFTLYEKYARSDVSTALQIFIKQHKLAKERNMVDVIKLYNQYMLCLTNVMNTGIPVDLEKCQKTLREFKLTALDHLVEATKMVEPMWDKRLPTFNVNSPKDKSAILFGGTYIIKEKELVGQYKNGNPKYKSVDKEIKIEGFKVPTSITNESAIKGRYQTGADIIEKIYAQSNNSQLKRYCELQKQSMTYSKMCSTYLEPFLNLSINGLLYPNYNNTMTITSRLSSSKPNLQNIPSKGDMLLPIQGQLVAPNGWICVSADYSQLEIYVSAYLANDPALTNDLLSGIDFHVKRLSYAEDMSYDELLVLCKKSLNDFKNYVADKLQLPLTDHKVEKYAQEIWERDNWSEKRTKAKTISYQKAYGASPASLSKTTGLSEELIKKIFDKEDIEYPEVAAFNKHVMNCVNNNTELSCAKHIPESKKGGGKDGKRFIAGIELLPILDKEGEAHYFNDEYRHVGYYTAITRKRYSFEEMGRLDYKGNLRRGYSTTQTKNYHIQGTASDVQAASSAALLPLLLKHKDKIKMVNEIHDSKWFLIKKEYLPQMLPIIRDIMEDVPKNFKKYLNVDMPFRIPVDFKTGNNFAEMEGITLE